MRTHWVGLSGLEEPLSVARERVRDFLANEVSCVEDAVLVVSELVGNALRHTKGGPDCLVVEVRTDTVVVWVHDPEADSGQVKVSDAAYEVFAESGRGLWLVQMLAPRWYVESTAIGKAVVAVLPRARAAVS
ncbi:ATP-binding protein [Streptomyces sp. NPDC005373]|uniref:ATP-binding protein n=1 Tax=Streptomyces sp. NPDC005373 TaxID=3156879 RepID=UPI0033B5439D